MTPIEVVSAALAEVGYQLTPSSHTRGCTLSELLAIPPDLLLRATNLGRMRDGSGPLDDVLEAIVPHARTRYAERWGLTTEAAR